MPTYEVTIQSHMTNPVHVHELIMQLGMPYISVNKVVKVTKEPFVLDVHNRDFTDTQALVDAVRYDSTPGSFKNSAIRAEHIRQAPTVDQVLHDSVVRLEGAVTQLKRALEQTIQKMTP